MCTCILHTAGSSTILNLFPTVPFIYMYFAGILLDLTSKVHVYTCTITVWIWHVHVHVATCTRHTARTYNIPVAEPDRAWPVEMEGDCFHRE